MHSTSSPCGAYVAFLFRKLHETSSQLQVFCVNGDVKYEAWTKMFTRRYYNTSEDNDKLVACFTTRNSILVSSSSLGCLFEERSVVDGSFIKSVRCKEVSGGCRKMRWMCANDTHVLIQSDKILHALDVTDFTHLWKMNININRALPFGGNKFLIRRKRIKVEVFDPVEVCVERKICRKFGYFVVFQDAIVTLYDKVEAVDVCSDSQEPFFIKSVNRDNITSMCVTSAGILLTRHNCTSATAYVTFMSTWEFSSRRAWLATLA